MKHVLASPKMGSQHPSPNVKTLCNFEPQIWPEIITSHDAKSACFEGSRTSCREITFCIFWPNFGRKRSHHVMDASCRKKTLRFFESAETLRFFPRPKNRYSLSAIFSAIFLAILRFEHAAIFLRLRFFETLLRST